MKIDSHQHFWRYNPAEYGWINDRMPVLQKDFLPSDLKPELKTAGFVGSVAVQARQSTEETRWLLKLAKENDFIRGVVGWVDLCSMENLMRQLDEFSKYGKFAGVRHVIHDEPDDHFMLREDFLGGLTLLKEYDLTYDLLLFPKHLKNAAKVAGLFPEQKFVLDHISKPLIRERIIDPWKEDIINLAQHKNVWCKLSGMVTEAEWTGWKPADFYPYLDVVYDAFGPDRLMPGSDWPVCLVAGSYKDVTGIVESWISEKHKDAGEKILGANCSVFYNLKI
jgi:L-fuconolactonase